VHLVGMALASPDYCKSQCQSKGGNGCCKYVGDSDDCQWCQDGWIQGSSSIAPGDASANCHNADGTCDGWTWGKDCSETCSSIGPLPPTPPPTPSPPPGPRKLVWADDFNGDSLNTDSWTIGLKGPNGDLVPGAKGAYHLGDPYADYITSENVIVKDGTLRLRSQKQGIQGSDPVAWFDYTSGWIQSMHKVHFKYGYIEARIKFPLGTKVWPAFWLLEERLVWGAEFDIAEYWGTPQNKKSGSGMLGQHLHTGDEFPGYWWSNWKDMCHDPRKGSTDCDATNWHTYGLRWRPDGFDYYIDGDITHSITASQLQGGYPSNDMYIILNNGVFSDTPRVIDPSETPWPTETEVDYVKIWKETESSGGGFLGGDVKIGLQTNATAELTQIHV